MEHFFCFVTSKQWRQYADFEVTTCEAPDDAKTTTTSTTTIRMSITYIAIRMYFSDGDGSGVDEAGIGASNRCNIVEGPLLPRCNYIAVPHCGPIDNAIAFGYCYSPVWFFYFSPFHQHIPGMYMRVHRSRSSSLLLHSSLVKFRGLCTTARCKYVTSAQLPVGTTCRGLARILFLSLALALLYNNSALYGGEWAGSRHDFATLLF